VNKPSRPLRIKLSKERRDQIIRSVKALFTSELDRDISDFQAGVIARWE
jgi:hypothetical protein